MQRFALKPTFFRWLGLAPVLRVRAILCGAAVTLVRAFMTMGFSGRPSLAKRQKELSRQQLQKEKAAQRAQRKEERNRNPATDGEDPDIAGIVPGPQPPLDTDS